ncbi:MAG: cytochrome c biogenesis protein CcdA [Deltaproteobacteria bacterium]|nr:cytochrome c biogenesis protein CcdA [Deltaproteobacteria bacterium]
MSFVKKVFLSLLLVTSPWSLVPSLSHAASPFQVVSPDIPVELKAGETGKATFTLSIPPDYFVYKDKTDLQFLNLEGVMVKQIQYPQGVIHHDSFFNKDSIVFRGETSVEVTFQMPQGSAVGKRDLEAILKLQGCSETLCYPEESHLIVFHLDIPGAGAEPKPSSTTSSAGTEEHSLVDLLDIQHFDHLFEQNWFIILFVVFLGGVLTSLTPCVLPLIPITLMIIGVRAQSPVRRNLILSLNLVLGLSLTYAGLGVLAVALGKSLGFVFQQKWFVLTLALFFFVLSLSMLGFFEIHLPKSIRHRLNHVKGHGKWGAFISGAISGVLAAPCAGPVVGSLLLFVSATKSYLEGFGLLFVYAMGMGVLFVVLGTGYGTLQGRFRKFPLSIWIKRGLGVVLLLGSFFYLNTVIPIEKTLTSFMRPEQVAWIPSEKMGLQKALAENKIILLDFYADWCAPCKEMETGFFRRPEVVALLQKMVPVRINATFSGNPEIEAILTKYRIVGWPTVLFLDSNGKVLKDLSVISYNPALLLKNMQKALAP